MVGWVGGFSESAVTVTRECGHALRQTGSHYQLPLARADVLLTVREGRNLPFWLRSPKARASQYTSAYTRVRLGVYPRS